MANEENRIKSYIDNEGNKYKYCNPLYVKYPKEKNVVIKKILVENPNDDNLFTLAIAEWSNAVERTEKFIFRWNIRVGERVKKKNTDDICVGFPITPKKDPEWIVLPDLFEYLRRFVK